ncbi:uncharacterized protein Z518_03020 [Rhinocladiella mackenziei CBS 650.93]|uniref:Rhinocladiella mackenziei CBS 650.93 unplaced genomic scaffold supercont1.2, whole genome shotgun sequence n=1 Tax=Rhinocladiella mackenziei CBS 650.93 TaxID=1442369 RepID=A0A0D2IQW4_9EURO|nr:uncharacterized protein Z518_03020 [Rhinocladiella mackenziei CBS 650.93]KIX08364.1 hypothetical protein Z518_03020 [Rhinocladiella mackenziei CBS 650.93]
MGFGSVTTPVPDYPNHSCPYGGLWYTCANNSIPFQGCCESNPCNGQGCSAQDLRPAGLHTVAVAGGSTFTVPSSVATSTPTSIATTTEAGSTTTPAQSESSTSSSTDTTAIAGGAAAAAVVLTILVGLALHFYLRRRRLRRTANGPLHREDVPLEHKGCYQDRPGTILTPLPCYPESSPHVSSPGVPFSPAPTYASMPTPRPQEMEPQEIMGLGLTLDEFHRRTKSRSPANVGDEPVELATQRFAAVDPNLEAKRPTSRDHHEATRDEIETSYRPSNQPLMRRDIQEPIEETSKGPRPRWMRRTEIFSNGSK